VGAKLFHANIKTDTKKLTVAFHNYSNVPKISDKNEYITTKTNDYTDGRASAKFPLV